MIRLQMHMERGPARTRTTTLIVQNSLKWRQEATVFFLFCSVRLGIPKYDDNDWEDDDELFPLFDAAASTKFDFN